MDKLKEMYYRTKFDVQEEDIQRIESETREQACSEMWREERSKRITASHVGSIAKMRKNTKRGNKVKAIL